MKLQARSPVTRGFTILEVVTVLAILVTLLALIVPAVQSARETARSMTCRNRLKQVGIANLSFHNTHREFPTWGRMWKLLPYLEQQPLHDALKPCKPFAIYSPDYDEVKEYPPIPNDLSPYVTTFICPSSNTVPAEYGVSYFVNKGTFWTGGLFDGKNITAVANGMASTHWYGGAVRMVNVYDGASNTAFFSETRQPLPRGSQPTASVTTSSLRFFWQINRIPTTTREFGQLCADAQQPFQPYTSFPARFDLIGYGHYQHIATPNDPACIVAENQKYRTIPPSSHHVGGVNILLVDGSVRFIADEIDLREWQQLGTRDSRLKEFPGDE